MKRIRSSPSISPAGPQQLPERVPVTEFGAVGIGVLSEEGDFHCAVGDQGLDFGEHVTGPAVFLLPRRVGTMQNVQVLLQPTETATQAV